jgi:hypothetical protein
MLAGLFFGTAADGSPWVPFLRPETAGADVSLRLSEHSPVGGTCERIQNQGQSDPGVLLPCDQLRFDCH